MSPLYLTAEQKENLNQLNSNFFKGIYTFRWGKNWDRNLIYIHDAKTGAGISYLPWFEFCFRVLAEKVADDYSSHHPSTTKNFSRYMVLQKLAHEVNKTHPVDLLYDIWKNPKNYGGEL